MKGQIPLGLFAIVLGALETAGGVQELVYRGILRSETEPLVIGTLGTIPGILLLAAGITLLIGAARASVLVQAAAYVAVPIFLLAGVVKHYAGWPITVLGICYPLLLLLVSRRGGKHEDTLSRI